MKLTMCNNSDYVWEKVCGGDTLNSICQKYSVPLTSVIRNNYGVDLYDGEVVKVLIKHHIYHTVKPMENLDLICKKYNINIDEIIKINNLNSKRVFVGQNLKIK